MFAALAPAVIFALSIPIALVDPRLAVLSWLLIFVAEALLGKFLPATD